MKAPPGRKTARSTKGFSFFFVLAAALLAPPVLLASEVAPPLIALDSAASIQETTTLAIQQAKKAEATVPSYDMKAASDNNSAPPSTVAQAQIFTSRNTVSQDQVPGAIAKTTSADARAPSITPAPFQGQALTNAVALTQTGVEVLKLPTSFLSAQDLTS